MPKFKTTVMQAEGMNATGIEVPAKIVETLGQGKKPKVTVAINGHLYRSTIAVYGGKFFLPLAAEHREKARIKAKDKVEVTLELDRAPREVQIPQDFATALEIDDASKDFAALAYTHRKKYVRAIEESKTPATRTRRIEKAVAAVLASRR